MVVFGLQAFQSISHSQGLAQNRFLDRLKLRTTGIHLCSLLQNRVNQTVQGGAAQGIGLIVNNRPEDESDDQVPGPLIEAATQEFHIDGGWADPRVVRVARRNREAGPATGTPTRPSAPRTGEPS